MLGARKKRKEWRGIGNGDKAHSPKMKRIRVFSE